MDHNPYTPPGSTTAAVSPLPPAQVRLARQLILGSLLLSLSGFIPGLRAPDSEASSVTWVASLLVFVVFGGFTVVLTQKFMQGLPWSRWATLAFLGFTWWLAADSFTEEFMRSPVSGAISAVCVLMEMAACVMLFTGAGAAWFMAKSKPDQA